MGGNKVSLNPHLVDTFPEAYITMGHTAERVAQRFEVSRAQQDAFALRSHEKALCALKEGVFTQEILPVQARKLTPSGVQYVDFRVDECPRADTSLESLAALKPVFSVKGTVTAGNASPTNDGAAACVLMDNHTVSSLGVKPLGRMRAFTVVGLAPDIMGIGPVPAIEKLLRMTGLAVKDIDLFEINEAFAAQAAYCQRALKIDDSRINVYGGAIALGHPLGCTGAKLTATLLHALQRRGGRYGIVSMCIGGGMGAAGLFEREG
jgi:acetyl-CoA acyltransferase